jgi:hypothetical protein
MCGPKAEKTQKDFAFDSLTKTRRKFSVRMKPRVARESLCDGMMLRAIEFVVKR